ncbi:glycine, alanine and asparagine-rich protein-like, partial [Phymastichus coffea]|uniref:glycine, alanine and asparagine-rich protein-like n=1 Tax=Phymastichus coffea TaxID=108790 RepID=UPI00273AAF2B
STGVGPRRSTPARGESACLRSSWKRAQASHWCERTRAAEADSGSVQRWQLLVREQPGSAARACVAKCARASEGDSTECERAAAKIGRASSAVRVRARRRRLYSQALRASSRFVASRASALADTATVRVRPERGEQRSGPSAPCVVQERAKAKVVAAVATIATIGGRLQSACAAQANAKAQEGGLGAASERLALQHQRRSASTPGGGRVQRQRQQQQQQAARHRAGRQAGGGGGCGCGGGDGDGDGDGGSGSGSDGGSGSGSGGGGGGGPWPGPVNSARELLYFLVHLLLVRFVWSAAACSLYSWLRQALGRLAPARLHVDNIARHQRQLLGPRHSSRADCCASAPSPIAGSPGAEPLVPKLRPLEVQVSRRPEQPCARAPRLLVARHRQPRRRRQPGTIQQWTCRAPTKLDRSSRHLAQSVR